MSIVLPSNLRQREYKDIYIYILYILNAKIPNNIPPTLPLFLDSVL